MKEGIELRGVIDPLRTELLALNETAAGEDLRFAVESIDVELHVGLTKEGKGSAKVTKFWMLKLGAEGKYGMERTPTIKLKLKPHRKGAEHGAETLIRGDGPDGSAEATETPARRG